MNASPKNQPVVGSARKTAKKGKPSPIRVAEEARKRAKKTPGSNGSKTMFNTLNNNIIEMVAERLNDALPLYSTSRRMRNLEAREKEIKKRLHSIPRDDLSRFIHKMTEIDQFKIFLKYSHLLPLDIQLEFEDHTQVSDSYIDKVVVPAVMSRGTETEVIRLISTAAHFLLLHILSEKPSIERRRRLLKILESRLIDDKRLVIMKRTFYRNFSRLPNNLINTLDPKTIFNVMPINTQKAFFYRINKKDRDSFLVKFIHLIPLETQLKIENALFHKNASKASDNYIDKVVIPALQRSYFRNEENTIMNLEEADIGSIVQFTSKAEDFLSSHIQKATISNVRKKQLKSLLVPHPLLNLVNDPPSHA